MAVERGHDGFVTTSAVDDVPVLERATGQPTVTIDPGETVIRTRLADAITGALSSECEQAFVEVVQVNEFRSFAIELREDETRQSPGRLVGTAMTYNEEARDRREDIRAWRTDLAGRGCGHQ